MQNNPFAKPATFASVLRFLGRAMVPDLVIVGGCFLVLAGLAFCAKH